MKVLYFAWLKDHIGTDAEEIAIPQGVKTLREMTVWLSGRGEGYAIAFENLDIVRAAIDQEFAELDSPIGNANEIAFFPPVTGG